MMNNDFERKIIEMEREVLALKQAVHFANLKAYYYEIDTTNLTDGEHTIIYEPGPYPPITEITTEYFGVQAIATPSGNAQKIWIASNRGMLRMLSTRKIISVD